MKIQLLKFLLFILVLYCLEACQKEKVLNQGWFEGLKNSESWLAQTHIVRVNEHNEIYMEIARFNEYGFLRETIPVYHIHEKTGTYILDEKVTPAQYGSVTGAYYYTSVDDGHATGNIYRLSENHYNYLIIEKINSNEITGRFQATFINDNLPDTIHFTHGEFKSAIRD